MRSRYSRPDDVGDAARVKVVGIQVGEIQASTKIIQIVQTQSSVQIVNVYCTGDVIDGDAVLKGNAAVDWNGLTIVEETSRQLCPNRQCASELGRLQRYIGLSTQWSTWVQSHA